MRIIALSLVSLFLTQCHSSSDQGSVPDKPLTVEEQREQMIERNRRQLELEREGIAAWVDSSKVDWIRTGTGLRYRIIEDAGNGKLMPEEIVELNYRLSLLNGYPVSSSAESGLKMVRVNKDNDAVLGLHEGLQLVGRGDSAIFLLPSHLAWGIAGDQNRIPPMTPVLYYVRIIEENQ